MEQECFLKMKKAFSLYQEASALGDAIAKANIGFCYKYGKGIQKNMFLAVFYYSEAFALDPTLNTVISLSLGKDIISIDNTPPFRIDFDRIIKNNR